MHLWHSFALPRRFPLVARYAPFACFAALAVAVGSFAHRYHEPWRDEVQVFLTARAVPWSRLLEACRVEGATPAIYVFAKILRIFVSDPLVLALVVAFSYALLLSGIFVLLRTLSRRPAMAFVVALGFAGTFSISYELGVIVRQYAAAMGLLFLSMAAFNDALTTPRSFKQVARAGALASLASLTATHAGCVSMSVAFAFAKMRAEKRDWRSTWTTMLATLPGLAATLCIVSPYANRTSAGNVPREGTIGDAVADIPRLFDAGLLPESRWHYSLGDTSTIHWYVMIAIGLAVLGEVFRTGRWSEATRLNFGGLLISWLPLLYIFVVRYRGYHRHHVFLVFPMLVVTAGLLSRDVFSAGLRSLTGTLGLALMTPWMLVQWRCASFDWNEDKKGLFCSTKTVAERLPAAAHVISDTNYSAIGVLFWRPDIVLRSTDGGGRTMTYNPPDADWLKSVPMDPLIREECRLAPDRVFVVTTSGFSGTPLVSKCAPPDATYSVASREEYEAWNVFGVDCACAEQSE